MRTRPGLSRPACAGWLLCWALAGAVPSVPAQTASLPPLQLPVACAIGRDCLVQNYVDADPGTGASDYRCGTRSYDAHDGTDIRARTLAQAQAGIDVLAAAPGRVLGRRDGMADVSVREAGPASVSGRECGNGVTLDHGDGWQTQYCHMAKGSVAVQAGDQVTAGQRLGRIGLSGLTEYPHLHFTVRQAGRTVDPFAAGAAPGSCGGGSSLWNAQASAALAYQERSVLNAGFADAPVTMEGIESGRLAEPQPGSAALVAYVRAIGLKAGDEQRLRVTAPDGSVLAENRAKALPRPQAQSMLFAGRKLTGPRHAAGSYRARYEVLRDGAPVLAQDFELTLRP